MAAPAYWAQAGQMAEAAQATAARQQTRFDQTDRDRIRRALLRYMEENRIGVPTLQKLVAEANDLTLDRLPLKTLQRFLADTHRSNDIMVRFCHRFAADLPDEDPLAVMGEALTGFFGVATNAANWQALPPDLPGDYAGYAEPAVKGLVRSDRNTEARWIPYSRLTIESLSSRPFAAVQEVVSNRNRTEPADDSSVRHHYEGVVLHPTGSLFMLMRNVLTGTPRLYWLAADEVFTLVGFGHESVGPLDAAPAVPALVRTARIAFESIAEGASS